MVPYLHSDLDDPRVAGGFGGMFGLGLFQAGGNNNAIESGVLEQTSGGGLFDWITNYGRAEIDRRNTTADNLRNGDGFLSSIFNAAEAGYTAQTGTPLYGTNQTQNTVRNAAIAAGVGGLLYFAWRATK